MRELIRTEVRYLRAAHKLPARSRRAGRRDHRALPIDRSRREEGPGLTTLVAAVGEWRGSSRAGDVALELDGEVDFLRTEA
jgi:hypothetical protein